MSEVRHISTRARENASLLARPLGSLTAILAATLLLFIQTSAATTFTAQEIASGDQGSVSIVSGDFNNDGILDVVTVNGSTLSFYKGLGGGKYAAPANVSFQNVSLGQVAAADFNGDGKLDLAISEAYTGLVMLLGNDDGTFTAGTNLTPYQWIDYKFAIADFNGDHIPDVALIVCGPPGKGCNTQVFLGQGDGTFKLSATLDACRSLVAGDFNGDGHQDLALGGGQVEVYLGDGTGQFQAPVTVSQIGAIDVAVGDFYHDGVQSMAVLNLQYNKDATESLFVDTVRYVNGQLVSSAPQAVIKEKLFPYVYIAAGDLNGDFTDDIVVAGDDYTNQHTEPRSFTAYMLGDGKGSFGSAMSAPASRYYESYPFVRDLNLDSRHDIGVDVSGDTGHPGGGAFVLLNTNAKTNCTPPPANKLGVHICAPVSGQTVPSTFTFKGAGNAFNGIAKRMELWIDGKKVGQNLEDQLRVTATLAKGTHTASFAVIDTFDNSTSQSVTFTVK